MKNSVSKFNDAGKTLFGLAMILIFISTSANAQKMERASVKSRILNQEREFAILLPQNYDAKSKKKYAVLYMLDSAEIIAAKFKSLSPNNLASETILVGIRPVKETRDIDLLPPYMKSDLESENSSMGRADKFLEFMETELMPYMKKNYKVSGINAVSGHSRGGVFTIYSLLAKPDLFQARFAFSPAVWREDNLLVAKTKEFIASAKIKKSFLYQSLGSNENDKMKSGFAALTDVFAKNPIRSMVLHSDYTKDADHQSNVELSISAAMEKWGDYLKKKK